MINLTTIYLMRHSEPFKTHLGIENVSEDLLTNNMKMPLSINGEKFAEKISNNKEFNNIDVVWSSNYVRAISTAKYFAFRNNVKVNISDKLGERIHGISSWSELPENFEKKQIINENYKINNGESQKEVKERMLKAINKILKDYKDKRILIVGHATAISFLLKNWCDVSIEDDKLKYTYKDNILLYGYLNYCETFKLEFAENNLYNIERIKLD